MSLLNIKMSRLVDDDTEYLVHEPDSLGDARSWLMAEAERRNCCQYIPVILQMGSGDSVVMRGNTYWIERF
jgi:hypothetical protein